MFRLDWEAGAVLEESGAIIDEARVEYLDVWRQIQMLRRGVMADLRATNMTIQQTGVGPGSALCMPSEETTSQRGEARVVCTGKSVNKRSSDRLTAALRESL